MFCAIKPSNQWGWAEILANKTNYYLETLAWHNTEDGQSKTPKNQPKLFVPEFMEELLASQNKDSQYDAKDIDDIKDILNKPRKAVKNGDHSPADPKK